MNLYNEVGTTYESNDDYVSVYIYGEEEVNIETQHANLYYSVTEAKEIIANLQKAVDQIEGKPIDGISEEDYTIETRRTAGEFDTQNEELTMLCMGLAGEAGEVVDTIKKVVFHGHPLDLAELTKELGDTHWYFTRLMDSLGINPAVVRQLNVEKLRKRFPNGFSSEDSIKRVDQ